MRVAPIHAGRSQVQRERALGGFARGHVRALVATDVAARGIHVDGVACVQHFDPPTDAKDPMHRSGRTARAGASGVVVSLVSADQVPESRRLQSRLGLSGTVRPIDLASLEKGGERFDPAWAVGGAFLQSVLITAPDARRFGARRRSRYRSRSHAGRSRVHR
jgi:superfamily II DNA/RNA helicase